MIRRVIFFVFTIVVASVTLASLRQTVTAQTAPATRQKKVDFNREIRPILSDTCFTCHGPDEATRQGHLRLDVKEGKESPFEPREGYRIVVSGNSGESRLYQKISAKDEQTRMPPPWSGRSLTAKQIELIRQWIDEGAEWETHWAFAAPKRPSAPEVKDKSWPRNPIDHFILARLEREGLKPSPEADKVTLLRRVSFDLTGLPPTPAEVDAFLADHSSNAYEKKVDQLLHSPHYGERMAMYWLDLARYADTHGYHIDPHREMWHWRDWVIDAFNRNKPFDQFTIEQLAGDLLPRPTLQQKIATGFNRNHMINFEGGAIPAEYHTEYVVDRIEATSTTWMALTLGCARCHDHKYDPLSQKDFYRFFAFFNNLPEKGLDGRRGNAGPVLQLSSPEQQRRLDELTGKIAETKKSMPEGEIETLQAAWQKTALSTVPDAPRDGLLAHFEFEGNLADSSGHPHRATTRLGEVTFGYGVVGKAAEFNGQTHLQLEDAGSFDGSQPFSLAFWVSPNSEVAAAKTILQKISDAKERRGYEIFLDEPVVVDIHTRAARLIVRLAHRAPDDAIEIKTKERVVFGFHHLTVNYDGSGKASGLKLCLDGKTQEIEVLRDQLNGSMSNSSPLEIGNKDLGRPFQGELDDFRIYSRQLTPEEIEQLVVHQPVRALLASQSGACAEMSKLLEKEKIPDSFKDPLDEQAVEDTPAYRVKQRCESEKEKIRDYFLTHVAPEQYRKVYAELKQLQKEKAELDKTIPNTMVMQEMEEPRGTFILRRGDYRNPGEPVTRGVPSILPPLPRDAPLDRLGLAKWLVSPTHPLTARVAVNHFWQMFFGIGLVKTAENFGSQGEPPSNPELLDGLATEFILRGWDIKAILRLIVTSATYRQSSRVTPELLEKDPENRLLARGPRFRLPAEMVRDNALFVSGLLNQEIGGPSVSPYQPKGLWEEMAFGEGYSAQSYTPSHGKDLYRRSMYTFWKRTVPPPSLATFDAPDREKCTARRLQTNTPLQALVLMNDPTYVEAARAFAQRTLLEARPDPNQRISYAFRLATGRQPAPNELEILRELAEQELANYRSNKNSAFELLRVGESAYNPKLDASELAAWTTVASTILSLDETITKE